jgi:hypothetical protein
LGPNPPLAGWLGRRGGQNHPNTEKKDQILLVRPCHLCNPL